MPIKSKLFKVAAALFTCTIVLTGCQNSGTAKEHQTSSNYHPVTITENLTGDNAGPTRKYTIKKMPKHVVVSTSHLANIFFDLGLSKRMAGYVPGMNPGTTKYPGQNKVKKLELGNNGMDPLSKEQVLKTNCDFLVGWPATFSSSQFSPKFCKKNGITPFRPTICADKTSFQDLYYDYYTIGRIFKIEKRADQKVKAMKSTIKTVHQKLGKKTYERPLKVLDLDFASSRGAFVGGEGMPVTIIKNAGGKSAISNVKHTWSTVSWEQIVKSDPDVIVINDYGTKGDLKMKEAYLKKNVRTKNLRAVKKNRIYSISSPDADGSAGSAKAVEKLAKDFYPEKFKQKINETVIIPKR